MDGWMETKFGAASPFAEVVRPLFGCEPTSAPNGSQEPRSNATLAKRDVMALVVGSDVGSY